MAGLGDPVVNPDERLDTERTLVERTAQATIPRLRSTPQTLIRARALRRTSRCDAGYPLGMTAKEKLLRDVLDLDEAKAARARIVVADEPEDEPEMAALPEGWGETLTGEPMPNVAAAVRRSRESH